MKRKKTIKLRLTDDELSELNIKVKEVKLSRESYIRSLINGYCPKEKPKEDYFVIINQLRRIGNNLNQLTMIAHKTGSIDIVRYKKDIAELNKNILEIREKVLLPEEKNHGNN